MVQKKSTARIRAPDPFDDSARERLIRMGLLEDNGQISYEAMDVFAAVFTGLFFDDLCDHYSDNGDILSISLTFRELYDKRDFSRMYLLLSLQYDCIRKPLPDPIWWLAGHSALVETFLTLFMERLECLMTGFGGAITNVPEDD